MLKPPDVVVVQLPATPVAAAEAIADALARCTAIDLFSIDGVPTWVRDGERVQITLDVLQHLVRAHVATKSLIERDGKSEAVYVPVVLDIQLTRAILRGSDNHPSRGGDLPGGSLASRLPQVSAAALGLAAA